MSPAPTVASAVRRALGRRNYLGGFFISGVRDAGYAYYSVAGPGFCVFTVSYAFLTWYAMLLLYQKAKVVPPLHRARIVAGFMAAIPVSIGLGAPVSTGFLELDGVLGLAGWKWLFLGEAAPRRAYRLEIGIAVEHHLVSIVVGLGEYAPYLEGGHYRHVRTEAWE